jgi:hypothetical protein
MTTRLFIVAMHIAAVFGGVYAGFQLFDAVTK